MPVPKKIYLFGIIGLLTVFSWSLQKEKKQNGHKEKKQNDYKEKTD